MENKIEEQIEEIIDNLKILVLGKKTEEQIIYLLKCAFVKGERKVIREYREQLFNNKKIIKRYYEKTNKKRLG